MARPDAFALKNSALNPFLFADVGTELNGSQLTILSILARLGQDPWSEAARLAKLPKAEARSRLTQSIRKMPLGPKAVAEMEAAASRAILLLPGQLRNPGQNTSQAIGTTTVPQWLPLALLCASLFFGMMAITAPKKQSATAAVVPATQTAFPAAPGASSNE